MSDPFSRGSFSLVTSLMHFMVEEGIWSKEQAVRFMDGLISATKNAAEPDERVLPMLEFVRSKLKDAKEPTKN
jgi:polyhydroxyalkanoate synthesis regulator phasin